jgi:hypothetical protein
MSQPNFFKINAPQVISETIDGETIIINLESGNYYSLNATGGEIWNRFREGLSTDEIVALFQQRYSLGSRDVEGRLADFTGELLKENLISRLESPPPRTVSGGEDLNAGVSKEFETPRLQKYDDMQDLLLLDPIHDVDETGWPVSKQVGA